MYEPARALHEYMSIKQIMLPWKRGIARKSEKGIFRVSFVWFTCYTEIKHVFRNT